MNFEKLAEERLAKEIADGSKELEASESKIKTGKDAKVKSFVLKQHKIGEARKKTVDTEKVSRAAKEVKAVVTFKDEDGKNHKLELRSLSPELRNELIATKRREIAEDERTLHAENPVEAGKHRAGQLEFTYEDVMIEQQTIEADDIIDGE